MPSKPRFVMHLRTLRFASLNLLLGSLLIACASAPPTPADPLATPQGPAEADARTSDPASPGPLEAALTPPPFVTLSGEGAILTVPTTGGTPVDTGLRPGPECADTVGIGSSSPVVSPDGRLIAFADARGELVVAPLAGGAPESLTRHGGGDNVCIQTTGWSADARRLLFHVGEGMSEDASPPPGLATGFFLWERGAGPARPLPWLTSANLLLPDGSAVLQVVDHATRTQARVLRRVSLVDQTAIELSTRLDPYAFGQLHVVGDTLTFADRETLEVAPLADVATARVLVTRPFAEAQWPRLAPDGRHLAWFSIARPGGVATPTLMVTPVGGEGARSFGPLAGGARSEVEWLSADRLLVCDGAGVRILALDGTAQPLAGPGTCFIPRGAR